MNLYWGVPYSSKLSSFNLIIILLHCKLLFFIFINLNNLKNVKCEFPSRRNMLPSTSVAIGRFRIEYSQSWHLCKHADDNFLPVKMQILFLSAKGSECKEPDRLSDIKTTAISSEN